MKMWSSIIICIFMILSTNAYSKYGRSCKDIGCLNSEVCVMAEDPCTFGRHSDCGTYPTCKKKTAADGETQNVPVTKATTPKPIADLKPQPPRYDDIPNYPPPAPPRGSSFGNNYPYGGGSSSGGSNYPYGGGSSGGGSNYPYGGGSSSGGSNYPHGSGGGSSSNGGFSNPFSGFNFGSVLGGGGSTGDKGSNPISSILTNILSNFTKGLPSLNPSLTRPGLIENRNTNPDPYNPYGNPSNYPSGGQGSSGYNNPYQRPGSYYPSYNQPSNTQGQSNLQSGYVAKNYAAQNSAPATTKRPQSYGWVYGLSIIYIAVLHGITKLLS